MLATARNRFVFLSVLVLALWPCHASAQSGEFCYRDPLPPHTLKLASPLASSLQTVIIPEGLAILFLAPPREETTYLSPAFTVDPGQWGVGEGEAVPGVEVSGLYLGVLDQRIELAVLQIGTDADSGVVGVDDIKMAWSSVFRTGARDEFILDAATADQPLPLAIVGAPGTPPDTTMVPGVRVMIQSGVFVRRGWRFVFDVEDFEGFHVWRWASDPNREPRAVGTYSKIADRERPDFVWFSLTPTGDAQPAQPTAEIFGFLDNFVIDGNVYHYAITTYDQGFDRIRGGALQGPGVPFDSPLPDEGCESLLRVDFLRPPPEEFQSVQAVPNPYRQVDCDPTDPLSTCTVRFIKMPPQGTLLIYTLAGDLVREFSHPDDADSEDPPGTLRWDTQNQSGQEVASGIYIYKIVDLSSGQESFGRLAIIR